MQIADIREQVDTLNSLLTSYETKQTKAASLRLRNSLNLFKKNITSFKALLVEEDKKQK